MLAQGDSDKKALKVFDTSGTPEGATAAARAARKSGATIILGPLFGREVSAVLGLIGRAMPVVSFSNDSALLDSGAFVFGITARQAASSILRYAASRGIRRIAIGGVNDGWGMQARAAASNISKDLGLDAYLLPAEGLGQPDSGALPDAVLMTDAAALARIGPVIDRQRVQLLGIVQGLDLTPEMFRALEGAWLAAPDPAGFAGFARAFEERFGTRPGTITGLAYDATNIFRQMRLGGDTDRSALLSASGFKGVCGDVRFREDGSVARALAILAIADGKLRTISQGTIT